MVDRYGGKKMVTISECGSFPDVDNLVNDAAGWSWMMVWNGDFVRSATYNSLDLWKKFMASDYVYTLDEMPNLKTYTNIDSNKSQSGDLLVFPTYFDTQLNIKISKPGQTISIYNELGICVTSFQTENNVSVVSTSSYPAGMYLIKIDGNIAVKVFKR
jgi:mannan endo-1,4-beta-mannosidase